MVADVIFTSVDASSVGIMFKSVYDILFLVSAFKLVDKILRFTLGILLDRIIYALIFILTSVGASFGNGSGGILGLKIKVASVRRYILAGRAYKIKHQIHIVT